MPPPNVVGPSCLLEYLVDGPDAGRFAGPLGDQETLIVPSLSVYEVFERVLQQRSETAALWAAALMQQGQVINLDSGLAMAPPSSRWTTSCPWATP
jgi:hypothetical protein